ncbi:RNA polymerase sigma factor [Arcticibacter eurypsychrophilus]|uniref:RNA polymerase sigma factor n=1 Tax=Arcticibacter eurypsychrophilus TaxID=1434752 RepID=UPI00084D66D8|nr:RNA polymerase sigma-70 factor [Arcticibacter eurypsychrophilus]
MYTEFSSDAELLLYIKQDERSAFDLLFKRYWERLFIYLVKAIQNEDDALDILQDIFISIWIRRRQIPEMESLAPYLFAAVHFKGYTYINNRTKKNRFQCDFVKFAQVGYATVEEDHDAKELNCFLQKEINDLPKKMKQVFVLSRDENLSHKEISERLHISDKTVKKQIYKALKQLRLRIKEEHIFTHFLLLFLLFCGSGFLD